LATGAAVKLNILLNARFPHRDVHGEPQP